MSNVMSVKHQYQVSSRSMITVLWNDDWQLYIVWPRLTVRAVSVITQQTTVTVRDSTTRMAYFNFIQSKTIHSTFDCDAKTIWTLHDDGHLSTLQFLTASDALLKVIPRQSAPNMYVPQPRRQATPLIRSPTDSKVKWVARDHCLWKTPLT